MPSRTNDAKCHLVKVLSAALSDDGSSMNPLVLKLQVLQLSLKAVFGLLSAGNLLVEGLNSFLSLLDTGTQLVLAALQLINAAKTLGLVLGPPKLALSLGLGKGLKGIRFLLILLFDALLDILQLEERMSVC